MTPTGGTVGYANVVLVSAVLEPSTLVAGQMFELHLTLSNIGDRAAATFIVATTFEPGAVYGAVMVDPLEPGQSSSVSLIARAGAPGSYRIAVVTDLNDDVNENAQGEDDNVTPFDYQILAS